MSPLANQLKWLIGIRLIVITSVALPAFLFELTTRSGPTFASLYYLAGLTYLASLIYIGLLGLLRRHLVLQAYIQFVGDLALVTGLVYESGGISSPYSMLYLIVISVAVTLLRSGAGLIVARIAWVLYASLLVWRYFGTAGEREVTATSLLIYNLLVHALGFYAVARLTSFLAQNVTRAERELVEKSKDLAELELFHRDVIESIASGLITTDLDGNITSINPAGRLILGRNEQQLLGTKVYDAGLLDEATWRRLYKASEQRGRVRDEAELIHEGERLYVGFSISSLNDEQGERRGLILIFQDLTEWRKLQEELQLKDRMAAVGELAAGLAHEIGNPLAAISGSVQMLSSTTPARSSHRKLLNIILQESQRLDRTIKGFLRYARPKERASVQFDIGKLLRENLELLGNSDEVLESHRLELDLDPRPTWLLGDPDQISQIFWNLARNSLRAMSDGGTLEVSGQLVGDRFHLRFRDTGKGMSENERTNLFHPFKSFFDGGSGIGMAIVYRIVEEHGGRISVSSQAGQGTSIEIELPALDPASIRIPAEA